MKRALLAWAAAVAAAPLAAQVDYRNLDDDRPLRVEDAYPVERYAFELIVPGFAAFERGGGHFGFVPELSFGVLPGAAIGLKAPLAGTWGRADDEYDLAGLRGFFLANLTTETGTLPGLAVRLDATAPVGGAAGEGASASIKALATRSFGRHRAHLNAAWGFVTQDVPGQVEPTPRWWVGLAVDRTLIRASTLLLLGFNAVGPGGGADTRWEAAIGVRRQLTPTLVVDAGASGRLAGPGENAALTLGLTHAFALAGLYPRPGRSR